VKAFSALPSHFHYITNITKANFSGENKKKQLEPRQETMQDAPVLSDCSSLGNH
jgi:hypothetical protein